MDGSQQALAAVVLCDASDETRLTHAELKKGWGGPLEFMLSFGLKPWKEEDCVEALAISRAFKESDLEEQEAELEEAKVKANSK